MLFCIHFQLCGKQGFIINLPVEPIYTNVLQIIKIEFSLSDKYLKKQEDQLAEEESRSFQLGTLTNGHWKYSVTRFHTICMNQITIYFFLGGFSQFSNCSESAQIQLSERWLFHFRLIEVSHLSTLCANNQCWACDKFSFRDKQPRVRATAAATKQQKTSKTTTNPTYMVKLC